MFYQAGLGGYSFIGNPSVDTEEDFYIPAPYVSWYEPAFNSFQPLQFFVPKCDYAYFLLRKRTDSTGSNFNTSLTAANLTCIATDTTTGSVITSEVATNTIYAGWADSGTGVNPLVVTLQPLITPLTSYYRYRTIDCLVTDSSDNSFIKFRAVISDSSQPFAYLTVYNNRIQERLSVAAYSTATVLTLDHNGSYTLLSPLSTFAEVSSVSGSLFSYPTDTIFYAPGLTLNREEYEFSIADISHPQLLEYAHVIPVPHYPYVGVLTIDGSMQAASETIEEQMYVDVAATAKISGNIDTFRVYFESVPAIYYL